MCQISFKLCRDMDDSASLEDMSFEQSMTERQERGSLTSVNTNASSCTTDSNGSFTNLRVSRIFHFLFLIYICIDIWQDMISYCISLYKNHNVWFIYLFIFFLRAETEMLYFGTARLNSNWRVVGLALSAFKPLIYHSMKLILLALTQPVILSTVPLGFWLKSKS